MATSDLLVDHADGVVVWRANRPDRLNAVTMELYLALEEAIASAAADPGVRAAVLTGSGRAFCVGADLKAHAERDTGDTPDRYVEAGQRVNRALQRFPKPTVAAINGHAIGAGMELALSCDFLIVSDDAKLRFPELGLGTFVGGGTVYTLPQRVGAARARELLLSGDIVMGRDAPAMALVTRSVPASEVLDEAMSLAHHLATKAPRSIALAKDLLDRAPQLTFDEAMVLEAEALRQCMQTQDWREGIAAFHEKRQPRFTGE